MSALLAKPAPEPAAPNPLNDIMYMTDPAPNPDLEVLLKWDGVGLPPNRATQPEVQPIENAEQEDAVAHENENPKSRKSSLPANPGDLGDSAS